MWPVINFVRPLQEPKRIALPNYLVSIKLIYRLLPSFLDIHFLLLFN